MALTRDRRTEPQNCAEYTGGWTAKLNFGTGGTNEPLTTTLFECCRGYVAMF